MSSTRRSFRHDSAQLSADEPGERFDRFGGDAQKTKQPANHLLALGQVGEPLNLGTGALIETTLIRLLVRLGAEPH